MPDIKGNHWNNQLKRQIREARIKRWNWILGSTHMFSESSKGVALPRSIVITYNLVDETQPQQTDLQSRWATALAIKCAAGRMTQKRVWAYSTWAHLSKAQFYSPKAVLKLIELRAVLIEHTSQSLNVPHEWLLIHTAIYFWFTTQSGKVLWGGSSVATLR